MIVSALKEMMESGGISRIDFTVIHEVLAGVFGVVNPAVLW